MARPKGSKSMITEDMRDRVRMLLEMNWQDMQEWINKLRDPKDKINTMLSLMEYTIPKLARTEIEAKGDLKLDITWKSKSPTNLEENN